MATSDVKATTEVAATIPPPFPNIKYAHVMITYMECRVAYSARQMPESVF